MSKPQLDFDLLEASKSVDKPINGWIRRDDIYKYPVLFNLTPYKIEILIGINGEWCDATEEQREEIIAYIKPQ